MSTMLTGDLVEITVFKPDEGGWIYLEQRDITLPKDDPMAGFAIYMTKSDRKHLIALLREVDK